MSQIQSHLEAALEHLNLDDELDRLISPRHTDHDVHVFLPRKVASEIVKAREAIQAAIDELSDSKGASTAG